VKQSVKACVFCASPLAGRRSKEHVFPQWLQDFLLLRGQPLHSASYTVQGQLEPANTRSLVLNAHVNGQVCAQCNHGWLCDLEGRAKPFLAPLFDGTFHGSLPPEDCEVIAEWLFKTALTLQSAEHRGECAVPPQHFAAFYSGRSIPQDVTIAVAPFSAGDPTPSWTINGHWRGIGEGPAPQALVDHYQQSYKITIHAGRLAWRVTYP